MSLKKIVVLPLIVAVLAFCIQIIDQLLIPLMKPFPNNGFCWIAFQAWAVYFLAGFATLSLKAVFDKKLNDS